MRIKAALAFLAISLLAGGSAWFLNAGERSRRPYPKAFPPPPPSPIYTPSAEKAQSEEEIAAAAATHEDRLVAQVARALATGDPDARETAFAILLPELVQVAPGKLVELFERLSGEPRDVLRTELASQWISRDQDAAMRWMSSLDEAERRAAAYAAVRTLAPVAPDQAIIVAEAFRIGRDDGFLDRLVQAWADDNIEQVERWLATQPAGPDIDALRVPLERARRQQGRERG